MQPNEPKWPPPDLRDLGEAAVIREFARMSRVTYKAFLAEGFSATEALALLIEVMRQSARK